MSGQVTSILNDLAEAIDHLELPIDNVVLTEAFALFDRLNAKLLAVVGEHDAAELWRNDGATSMTAWLRHHTRRSGRDAAACARTARRLRELPVTAAAYRDGVLSGGHVQAIVTNLNDRTVDLFTHHESELVPELARLSVGETATAMQSWARHADAVLGDKDKPQPERSLHLWRIWMDATSCRAASIPKAAPSSPPPCASPPPAMSTANPPAARPSDEAMPWSTCAAGSSTINRTAGAAAIGRISTSSPPSTTSSAAVRAATSATAGMKRAANLATESEFWDAVQCVPAVCR